MKEAASSNVGRIVASSRKERLFNPPRYKNSLPSWLNTYINGRDFGALVKARSTYRTAAT
jgi:hypothetical protein